MAKALMSRALAVLLVLITALDAAPQRGGGGQALQQTINGLHNELASHDEEIAALQERIVHLESTIELLRDESKKTGGTTDERLDQKLSRLTSDMQKMRSHANEIGDLVSKTAAKVDSMEKGLHQQELNLGNMQAALKSVLEAFDMKDSALGVSGSYKVQSGDSLERIAKKVGTSIGKLKELNGLKGDQIRVGQVLKTP